MTASPLQVTDVVLSSSSWSSSFVGYLEDHGFGEGGYRMPTGSAAQLAPLPWNSIDRISIGFTEDVSIQQNDLAVSSATALSIGFSHFRYDPQAFVATWTLAAPLDSDAYRLDLDGDGVGKVIGQFTAAVLDGEWTDGVSSFGVGSGNGTAGGDFEFTFRVLVGDADQGGQVGSGDWNATYALTNMTFADVGYDPKKDVDGSGVIGSADLDAIDAALGDFVTTNTPLGAYNDAPSAKAISTKKITNPAATINVSLFSPFSDAETSDSSLSFSYVASNPSLFDLMSFSSSTGNLSLSSASGVSGRSKISVTATDQGGMATTQEFWVDVNYTNLAPTLWFGVSEESNDTWILGGTVSDGDDFVEGMYVYLSGAVQGRAVVDEYGFWEFAEIVSPEEWGEVTAVYKDPHGTLSEIRVAYIGWL